MAEGGSERAAGGDQVIIMAEIKITAGSSIRLLAQLGVDLTGAGPVTFAFEPVAPVCGGGDGFTLNLAAPTVQSRAATVTDVTAGTVSYTLTGTDTAAAGHYRGQFTFTDATGAAQIFPATGWIHFTVEEFAAPVVFSNLCDFYEPIRAMVGDFRRPYQYEDLALAGVVRSVIRLGKVPRFGITADGVHISPAITSAHDLALLVYNAAKILVGPKVRGEGWGARALKVRRNDQREFWQELQSLCYYEENPAQMASFQSYYSWVNSLAGINVWGLMTEMRVQGPVATATIGTAGITVNTT